MEDHAPPIQTEDDLFYFESDHLALKGNEDYCNVLKTIVILTAQREQALKDFKKVAEMRVEALNNPVGFVEKIKNGSSLDIPNIIQAADLPKINFDKYQVKIPENLLTDIYSEDTSHQQESKGEIKPSNSSSSNNIRAWTPEEQKRLEELLQIYPPEPIEKRRFQKIAKALGNRTTAQVASRIQKYFLKLYKAGLPVPGRIPKAAEKYRRSAQHKHQRHNHYLWKPTSFFPELNVRVPMDDLGDIPGPQCTTVSSNADQTSDNYLVMTDYHQPTEQDPTELKTQLLQRVMAIKQIEEQEGYEPFSHYGSKCNYCGESPITGTRWHCVTCEHIDYCTDCVVSDFMFENPHPLNHELITYQNESNRVLNDPISTRTNTGVNNTDKESDYF